VDEIYSPSLSGGSDMAVKKYPFPGFLVDVVSEIAYRRWLHRKASAHRRRDRKRGNLTATIEEYKWEIHRAVMMSNGIDFYTGERLDWKRISKYNNIASKHGKRAYKKLFALLPTVDHVTDGRGRADFVICGWRTNDSKNDMTYEDFRELCEKVDAIARRRKELGLLES
jgi:hypothetical protein